MKLLGASQAYNVESDAWKVVPFIAFVAADHVALIWGLADAVKL